MKLFSLLAVLLCCLPVSAEYSAADFFIKPDIREAHLSPDGKYVALIKETEAAPQIDLFDVANNTRSALFDLSQTKKKETKVLDMFWLGNRYIAVELGFSRQGVKDLMDTKHKVDYLILDTQSKGKKSKVYTIKARGRIVHPLLDDAEHFLFSKNGVKSRVYKLKVSKLNKFGKRFSKLDRPDGGQLVNKNQVAVVEGGAIRWFIDNSGIVRSVAYLDLEKGLVLASVEEGKVTEELNNWLTPEQLKELKDKSKNTRKRKKLEKFAKQFSLEIRSLDYQEENNFHLKDVDKHYFIPVKPADTPNRFFGVNVKEDNIQNIYLIDYEKMDYELVYESVAYRITEFETNPARTRLARVNLVMDGRSYVDYLDDEGKSALNANETLDFVIAADKQNKVHLRYREDINNSGRYSVITSQGEVAVGERYPSLAAIEKVELIKGKVEVDELQIEYLLTLPKVPSAVPLVVMPHGGPIGVFDGHYFDPSARYLNQQGYAVLRVNYRGSGGYSKDFVDQGKKQWGEGILKDIHEATLAVSQRSEIDSERICIAGMSYGGYAAAMLTIDYPQTYKCGATIAGVSDVYLTVTNPRLTKAQYKWVKEYIADVSTDIEQINRISPIHNVEKLTRPLLVVHGTKDEIVDIEHAYRLKLMLDKFGKGYEFVELPESGHQFAHEQDLAKMFEKLAEFLNSKI